MHDLDLTGITFNQPQFTRITVRNNRRRIEMERADYLQRPGPSSCSPFDSWLIIHDEEDELKAFLEKCELFDYTRCRNSLPIYRYLAQERYAHDKYFTCNEENPTPLI